MHSSPERLAQAVTGTGAGGDAAGDGNWLPAIAAAVVPVTPPLGGAAAMATVVADADMRAPLASGAVVVSEVRQGGSGEVVDGPPGVDKVATDDVAAVPPVSAGAAGGRGLLIGRWAILRYGRAGGGGRAAATSGGGGAARRRAGGEVVATVGVGQGVARGVGGPSGTTRRAGGRRASGAARRSAFSLLSPPACCRGCASAPTRCCSGLGLRGPPLLSAASGFCLSSALAARSSEPGVPTVAVVDAVTSAGPVGIGAGGVAGSGAAEAEGGSVGGGAPPTGGEGAAGVVTEGAAEVAAWRTVGLP